MNIVGNHNNISIKISFAEIKNKAEELFGQSLNDNQIKEIMDIITDNAQSNEGITQNMINNIIIDYKQSA